MNNLQLKLEALLIFFICLRDGVCMFNILMKLGTFYLECIWIERCHVCWIYILIEFCTRVSKTLRCKQQTNTTRLSAIERISVKLFTTVTSENEEKKKRSYIFCLYHPHSHFDDLAESTCSPWLLACCAMVKTFSFSNPFQQTTKFRTTSEQMSKWKCDFFI